MYKVKQEENRKGIYFKETKFVNNINEISLYFTLFFDVSIPIYL